VIYGILNSIFHIIESILSQDELPDFYEEQLPEISKAMVFIIQQDFPQLPELPKEVIKARGKVVSLTNKYQFKFAEYFQAYSDLMFEAIWSLVANNKVPIQKHSKKLLESVISYLTQILSFQFQKGEFIKANLPIIFEILVLPHISLSPEDLEEYEDDPQSYLRNDLEEQDAETKRRISMKFVHFLGSKYSTEVV
jgi:exportin-2 (importin alpha re-exporter)